MASKHKLLLAKDLRIRPGGLEPPTFGFEVLMSAFFYPLSSTKSAFLA